MAKLTEAEMIARYDAERSGTAYVKPQPRCLTCGDDGNCPDCGTPSTLLLAVADLIDTPISDVERKAIAALYPSLADDERARGYLAGRELGKLAQQGDEAAIAAWMDKHLPLPAGEPEDTDGIISILEACNGGERKALDVRFDTVINQVFDLPDSQRAIAVGMWEGFVAGAAIGGGSQ